MKASHRNWVTLLCGWMSQEASEERCPAHANALLPALDLYNIGHGMEPFTSDPAIRLVRRRCKRIWDLLRHKTQALTFLEVEALSLRPMAGVNALLWKCFVWTMWVFAIRIQEMKFLNPTHISYDSGTQQWTCIIAVPKTKLVFETQHVWIPIRTVPAQVREFVQTMAALNTKWEGWTRVGIHCEKLTQHLQKELVQAPKKKLWTHSFRHGRLLELSKRYGLFEEDVMKVARHTSRNAVRKYLAG